MFPANKHSYLHSRTHIDPRIINRSLDLARGFQTADRFDEFHPFNRVTSSQPSIPIPAVDITRRPVAFGRWAIPILRRDLHHEKHDVVLQTLNSLIEIVHDPERNIEAIDLKIPDRLADLLEESDPVVRERACMALITMCCLLDGKYAVVKNKKMLRNLATVLCDPIEEVRYKAVRLIEEISQEWMAADKLVDKGFIELIIARVKNLDRYDSTLFLSLRALEMLMYCNGKNIAMENGLFEILLGLLDAAEDPLLIKQILKCISLLTQTEEGLQFAINHKLLRTLYSYLHDDRVEIYENAACAMLFLTINCKSIVKSFKLPNFIERLILLAGNHHEVVTQRYCLQILANLGAHVTHKIDYVTKYKQDLENIYVGHDEHAARLKDLLFDDIVMPV